MYMLEKDLKIFSYMFLCRYKLESDFYMHVELDRTLKLIFTCMLILNFVSF